MPKLIHTLPKYQKHRASGQAVVTLDGQDIYLGPYGSKASRAEYDRLTGEWLANGRRVHRGPDDSDLTVTEIIERYWDHARVYYAPADGSPSGEIDCQKAALKLLKRLYGPTRGTDFGPLAMDALRGEMLKLDWSRNFINAQTRRIRRVFKWAASKELIPATVYQRLQTIEGLREGKTKARETDPVTPVADATVDAVRTFLSPVIEDMIDLQLATGMRPGELVIMRGTDIDTSGDVWLYRPAAHKTKSRGFTREVFIGPKAKAIVEKYLTPDVQAFLFTPKAAAAARHAKAKAHRRPDQKPNPRKTRRKVGERYTVDAYRRAVARACDRAFTHPKLSGIESLTTDQVTELKAWQAKHRWHPHQLRHSAATRLRRQFDLETARVVLGHQSVDITEVYAQADVTKARQAMASAG